MGIHLSVVTVSYTHTHTHKKSEKRNNLLKNSLTPYKIMANNWIVNNQHASWMCNNNKMVNRTMATLLLAVLLLFIIQAAAVFGFTTTTTQQQQQPKLSISRSSVSFLHQRTTKTTTYAASD